MYSVNNLNQKTCAPHPNILATRKFQFSENLNISSRCVKWTLDETLMKNIIFFAFDFTESRIDYFMYVWECFLF